MSPPFIDIFYCCSSSLCRVDGGVYIEDVVSNIVQ